MNGTSTWEKKKGDKSSRRGEESEIMRDNDREGGVVPENTKWAGGRGRENAGESEEKAAERERRKGRCIMMCYVTADQVWHKRHRLSSPIKRMRLKDSALIAPEDALTFQNNERRSRFLGVGLVLSQSRQRER